MPLTDEQSKALDTLATADAAEFADALKAKAQPLYQHVWKGGFKESEQRWKPRAEAAESKVAEVEGKVAEAEAKLSEAQSRAPDVKAINDEWQQKLAKAKADAEAQVAAERTARQQERAARTTSDLKAALSGLDPIYIDAIAATAATRLRHRDDGGLELLEPGGQTPVALSDGTTPIAHLASELKAAADPRWVLSNADRGAGTTGGGGGGGGGGGDLYSRIRADVQKQQETQARVQDAKPLAERLGQKVA